MVPSVAKHQIDSIYRRGFVTPAASIMRIRNTRPIDFEQVAAEEHRRAGLLARLSSDSIERAAWGAIERGGV